MDASRRRLRLSHALAPDQGVVHARLGPWPPAAGADARRRARGEQTVWQHRYWEHLVRNDRDLGAHVEYIHFNPVRHGLVSAPRDWPHSTFSDWVARGLYDADWGSQGPLELPAWAGHE